MTKPISTGQALRQQAESVLAARPVGPALSEGDALCALHELQVHQIELELQNEEMNFANLELQRANAALAAAQSELMQAEKMAAVGQLAAGVAHEINNPIGYVHSNLGTMAGYVDDLLELLECAEQWAAASPDDRGLDAFRGLAMRKDLAYLKDDIRHLLVESLDGVDRVRVIVQNLMSVSLLGQEEWQWVDLHQSLDAALKLIGNEPNSTLKVVKSFGMLPKVYCVAVQINQVFLNLLVNAAQAIEASGTITLRSGVEAPAGLAGEKIWIEVEDTGLGIAPEHLNRIFDPFFTTKPVGKGMGLGLSQAWRIVQKHQGQLTVRSQSGEGTCFRLSLPVRPESVTVTPNFQKVAT